MVENYIIFIITILYHNKIKHILNLVEIYLFSLYIYYKLYNICVISNY